MGKIKIWVAWRTSSLWVDAVQDTATGQFLESLDKLAKIVGMRKEKTKYVLLRAYNYYSLGKYDQCEASLRDIINLMRVDSDLTEKDRQYLSIYISKMSITLISACHDFKFEAPQDIDVNPMEVNKELLEVFPLT
jgi:hypothetical protein